MEATNKISVEMGHLEGQPFVTGLRVFADRSNNFRVRLDVAKMIRQIEKKTKDHFNDYNDLLRVYGRKNAKGQLEVQPAQLTQEQAKEWETKYEEWRGKTIEIESDLITNGRLTMKLAKEHLNAIPAICLEVLLDYVELVADDAKDDKEALREKVAQLETEVKALKEGRQE